MDLKNIKIEDPFWGHMQELVTDVVIPFQEDVLNDRQPGVEKSHAIENFKIAAGLSQGEFYGMVFQDSDVAKWLEGVAYSLAVKPDNELEARADEIIDIIKKSAKHLESVSIFDMYKGEQVPEGKKSLSYNLVLRKDGSMTDEEADAVVAKVLKALAEKNITLRA